MVIHSHSTIKKYAAKIEKLRNKRTQTDALYCIETTDKNYILEMLIIFRVFLYGFSAFIFIALTLGLIFLPVDTPDEKQYAYALTYMCVSIFLIAVFLSFYNSYQIANRILLYKDKIVFNKKNKPTKEFSYEQVSEVIRRDGFTINKGFLEIKLEDCKLKLEVSVNDRGFLDKVLKFLEEKTGITMPVLSKDDKLLIQRTRCLSQWFKIYDWCFLGDVYVVSFLSITPSANKYSFIEIFSNFFISYIPFSSMFGNYFDYHMIEAVALAFGLLLIPTFFMNIIPFKERFSGDKLLRIK